MWSNYTHDFGNVQEPNSLITHFEYLGDKPIYEITSSCTCTKFTFENNLLTVTWKINQKRTNRKVNTYLAVEYQEGSIEDLKLEANVYYTG